MEERRTAAGTVLVKNIRTANGVGSGPRSLVNLGGTLYFVANDGSSGYELWKSDGTDAGTVLVKDIWLGLNSGIAQRLTVIGNSLYFAASDGINGNELWRSNGTASGTVMVQDISAGAIGSDPTQITDVSGDVYFTMTMKPVVRKSGRAMGPLPGLLP